MTNLTQSQPKNIFKRMEARTRCPPRRVKTSKRARQTHKSEYSKMSKIHPKIVTKWFLKSWNILPKSTPGPPPGTLLEQRSLLRPLISPFLAPKGSPMGPQNRQKNRSFFRHVFEWLFGTTFSCFWPPFGLPKRPQNETKKGPNTKSKNNRFCNYLLYLSHIEGSNKSTFLLLFWDPF